MKKKPRNTIVDSAKTATPVLTSSIKPLVFVSHDSRDAGLAELFSNLLTDASGGILRSFRSSDKRGTSGIEFGAEWYNTIMSKIGDATDVVALLTQHSVDRPWILYEAGVAKGKLNTTVFGLAIGISLEKASSGPFAQFQNSGDDEDSLTKLVLQLIQKNPEASPREEAVRRQVKAFQENIQSELKEKGKEKLQPRQEMDETVAKLFEEVKLMFRELPEQMELLISKNVGSPAGLKRRRNDPRQMLDIAAQLLDHSRVAESPTGWLIFLTTFREQIPWLYEPGLDLYRAFVSGGRMAIAQNRRNLQRLLFEVKSSGISRIGIETRRDESNYYFQRYVIEMIDRYLRRIIPGSSPKPVKAGKGSTDS
jgi:hypothetical protein